MHNDDLCPLVDGQVAETLNCFLKYEAISHDIQGLRDHGVDVLLKYRIGSDADAEARVVAIQIKSYADMRRSGVGGELKRQFFDARSRYRDSLERYYVLLCTDEVIHRALVRDITGELSSEPQIRVISPRYALTFMHMPATVIAGTVDRLLRSEDCVHKSARDEIADLSPIGFALLLDAMVGKKSGQELEQGIIHPSYRVTRVAQQVLGDEFDEDVLTRSYHKIEERVFTRAGVASELRLRVEQFPALACLLLDAGIRFDYSGDELFDYIFESFRQSAVESDAAI